MEGSVFPGIIDTHIHLWQIVPGRYEWLKQQDDMLRKDFDLKQLEQERSQAGITGGVLVQADNNLADTDMMLRVAETIGWIKGVTGWLPLMDPVETSRLLEKKYKDNDYFVGVRHLIHDEPDARWLLQPSVIESLTILAERNLVYEVVAVLPSHIETALEVAGKIPGLRMVFDHLSQPPVSAKETFGTWGKLMAEAALHPNFFAKISGLGTASKNFNSWTAADIRPYIEFCLEHFGYERCFCGGDWPVSLLAGSYTKTWDQYKLALDVLLTPSQKEGVFYNNAVSFYNLNVQGQANPF